MIWREDLGISKRVKLHPKVPAKLATEGDGGLQKFTMSEVAKHNTKGGCWIILDNRVCDITRFIDRHPGGVGPVVNMASKDATDVFDNYHQGRVYRTTRQHLINRRVHRRGSLPTRGRFSSGSAADVGRWSL